MDALTFALPKSEKKRLDVIAHEFSIKEKKKITNGELVRRAIRDVYGITPDGKQKKAGKSNRQRRK
jgi:hypothetical protein